MSVAADFTVSGSSREMIMKKFETQRGAAGIAVGVFALAIAIIGCGGGGSAGVTSGSTATAGTAGTAGNTYPGSATLHTYTGQETYGYTVTAVKQTGGANPGSPTSALRSVFVSAPAGEPGALEFKTIDSFIPPANFETDPIDIYIDQDGSGNLLFEGDKANSVNRTAATPESYLPGAFSAATVGTQITALNPGGGQFANSYTIGATTSVTIGLGSFTVYPVSYNFTIDGVTHQGTYDFAPKLGSYVEADEIINNQNTGVRTTLHAELNSYSGATP